MSLATVSPRAKPLEAVEDEIEAPHELGRGVVPGLRQSRRDLGEVRVGTFLFGPGLAIGINTTLLATLMYRSQLVPRTIAVVGLIGGPLVFASSIAVLFGLYEQTSAAAGLAAFPVFAWEMSLAGWMIFKGFKPSPTLDRAARPVDFGARVATASSY